MAILTKSGRIAMAKAIAGLPIFMCWGQGGPGWEEEPPAELVTAAALLDVVGYRAAASVQFCETATDGEISIPSGRFTVSQEPTNHLYLRFVFDFEDAEGKTIREIGVMTGTTTIPDLPEGQHYFLPEQVQSAGDLLLLEHRKPLYREIGVRETFEFVVTF